MSTTEYPPLPAGYRWQRKNKRAWAFMTLQKKTWFGWRTIEKSSVSPMGMSLGEALISTAWDIADRRNVAA